MSEKKGTGPLGVPTYDDDPSISQALKLGLTRPHMALLAGINEWIPIVEGCTIALITDRSKIDGIAPYVVTKMSWKPGRESITLVAVGETGTQRRILKLGSKYMGHHTQSLEEADQVVDAAVAAVKPDHDDK